MKSEKNCDNLTVCGVVHRHLMSPWNINVEKGHARLVMTICDASQKFIIAIESRFLLFYYTHWGKFKNVQNVEKI